MLQITLISHQHDDNIVVSVFTELFEPAVSIHKGLRLGNVVDQQGTHRATIISTSNSTISFLASYKIEKLILYLGLTSVPYLSFNYLPLNANRTGRKLNTDSTLTISIKLIGSETHQQIRFTDTGITN